MNKIIITLHQRLGLSWPTPFLVAPVLMLCAGFTGAPGHVEAAVAIYTATEAGVLPTGSTRVVRSANESGEIVGTGQTDKGQRGFFLGGDGLQEIAGLPPGSDYSTAFGINKHGQVVGSVNTATGMRAFRSERATKIILLETLPSDTSSSASAINSSGKATGWASGADGIHAVIWSPAGTIQALPMLPASSACRGQAINDRDDVAGACDTASGPRAVLWTGGAVQDLGALPGDYESAALGINNHGDVVGSSGNPEAVHHAVLWPAGGAIQSIGALSNRKWSQALAINDNKEVVGVSSEGYSKEHAFLWTENDGLQDLNDLLPSSSGFELTHAIAISAQGRIVAIGHDKIIHTDGGSHETHNLPLRIFRLKHPVGGAH
jgi:probable HAF family extracellular repeat protein